MLHTWRESKKVWTPALEQNIDRSGIASVAGSVDWLTCTTAMPLGVSLEPVWTAGLVGMIAKKRKLAGRENPRKDNLGANLETSTLEKKITSRKIN